MPEIRTRHLFTISLETGAPQKISDPAGGGRLVVPVTGGSFQGERMRGSVLPGGSDWITIRPSGAFALDVRIVLQTEDGALIAMAYRGLRHGPAEVLARLAKGEQVDPATYYFRIAPTFETQAGRYDWLNHIVAVGTGDRRPSGPVYDVFEVL
jgi:hypothetical protein